MQDNTISVHDFIQKLDKDSNSLFIPAMQRPPVWKIEKINKILKIKNKEYFGAITISINDNGEFILLDGQQRMTLFLAMYKLSLDFKNERILDNENISMERRPYLGYIFGNKCTREEALTIKNDQNKYKELKELTGYVENFEFLIDNFNKAGYINILKQSFISVNIINSSSGNINEYDIFTSINNEGQPLYQSDLIKTFFLKQYNQKKSPIDINTDWRKITESANDANNVKVDDLYVMFLSSKQVSTTRTKIFEEVKNDFDAQMQKTNEKNKTSKCNEYIKKNIRAFMDYSSNFTGPLSFVEPLSNIPTSQNDLIAGFTRFVYSSGIYKPFIEKAVWIRKNTTKADDFRKMISSYLKLIYSFVFNQKIENYNHLDQLKSFKKTAANKVRVKSTKNLNSVIDLYIENVLGYKPVYVEEIFNEFIEIIIKNIKRPEYGKTVFALLEWYISNEKQYFPFIHKFTLEHVIQSLKYTKKNGKEITVSNKNFSSSTVLLLEKKLVDEMDKKIQVSSESWRNKPDAILNSFNIKVHSYSKSSSKFTKYFSENFMIKPTDILREKKNFLTKGLLDINKIGKRKFIIG